MSQVISTLILTALCASVACASPRNKRNSQAACEAYINERWDAEQGAIRTSRRSYRRLVALGLGRGLSYSDSVREIPILYWKYSRKRSRRCRRIFARSSKPDSCKLTAKALKMETDSQRIDDAWFRVTVYQGFRISDSQTRQQIRQGQELPTHPGCDQTVPEGDAKNGAVTPPSSTGPCP